MTDNKKETKEIHIQWAGPFPYPQKKGKYEKKGVRVSYGIYQIYGTHPVYGSDALLYIGKAVDQTFRKRLTQHNWDDGEEVSSKIEVYLGYLHGYRGTPTDEEWSNQIDLAEKLLIFSHYPAGNSSDIKGSWGKKMRKALQDIHVFNWGKRHKLLPEVSGTRYRKYKNIDNYKPYILKTPPKIE